MEENPSKRLKRKRKSPAKWARTTIVIDEEHLEKLKVLAWWEKTTIKDLFDVMIKQYLSSHQHLDRLLAEREQSLVVRNKNS